MNGAAERERGRVDTAASASRFAATGRARLAAACALAAMAAPAAGAGGDREYGAYLAGQCVACHAPSGPASAGVPAIVAWPEAQFVAVLQSYRSGERDHMVMQTLAAGLSDEDMSALAAYFAALKPTGP